VSEQAEKAIRLIEQSGEVPEGDEQISLCEEAVRAADAAGDLKLQYYARDKLVSAGLFGGHTEKALVAYSWCLAQFDKNPGVFSQWTILWKYKWMMGQVRNFPQVPKDRIYEMLDDLTDRMRKAGYGMRAVYNQRYRLEKFWDNKALAVEYFRKMEEQPRDEISNCSACELDDRVSFHIYCGEDARALELARPIVEGQETCGSVPHHTYANLLLPLVRLGRQPEALVYHRRGYELIADNLRYLDDIGDHLIFLALTENFERALSLFAKHYSWIEKSKDLFHRFGFFRAAWLLFELVAVQERKPLRLALPRSFPGYQIGEEYDPVTLAAWFKDAAAELGRRFDERNDTDAFASLMFQTSSLKALARPFPLTATETRVRVIS
jgi:tetratricopeptide (TPR) repeat protein